MTSCIILQPERCRHQPNAKKWQKIIAKNLGNFENFGNIEKWKFRKLRFFEKSGILKIAVKWIEVLQFIWWISLNHNELQLNSIQFIGENEMNWIELQNPNELNSIAKRSNGKELNWIESQKFIQPNELNWIEFQWIAQPWIAAIGVRRLRNVICFNTDWHGWGDDKFNKVLYKVRNNQGRDDFA